MDSLYAFIPILIMGIVFIVIGMKLGSLFKTQEKIRALGLDRLSNLTFSQQTQILFDSPSIAIPMIIIFFGAFCAVISFVMIIISIFTKLIS